MAGYDVIGPGITHRSLWAIIGEYLAPSLLSHSSKGLGTSSPETSSGVELKGTITGEREGELSHTIFFILGGGVGWNKIFEFQFRHLHAFSSKNLDD